MRLKILKTIWPNNNIKKKDLIKHEVKYIVKQDHKPLLQHKPKDKPFLDECNPLTSLSNARIYDN